MGQATSQIEAHIEDTRADLGSNLHELEQKVRSVTDWKQHFQTNPMTLLGVAFAGGILLATMLSGRKSSRRGELGFSSPATGPEPQAGTDHQKHKALETWDNIKGALTGVNQNIQKLHVVNRCHCPNLFNLRFQGNAPVGLFVCRNSHVTDRFCFHMLKKLNHTRGGRHKLSGYRFGSTSVWETLGERALGRSPASTRTAATASAKVSGESWRRCRVCDLWRVLLGSHGAATAPAGGFVCGLAAAASVPRRPTQEKTGKGGQQHRQQRSPPQKEERQTLRPVVASATEPGGLILSCGPCRRERCGLCLWGWRPLAPTRSRPGHGDTATGATGPSKPCCGSCYSGRLEWMLWHRRAVLTSLRLSQGENNDEQAFIGDAPLICRNGFRRADLDRQDQR